MVHSLGNVIHGDTLLEPAHLNESKSGIKKFDYIVSNPPFKTDFSETRDILASEKYKERFFAGVPNIPEKSKDKMAIYLLFIQHILASLNENGKAAIVVPTGFLSAKSGIELKIKKKIIENRWLVGTITMPSNIFANTGTNVSVVFLNKDNTNLKPIFIDGSSLGYKVKDGRNQRTLLSPEDIDMIEKTFIDRNVIQDFSTITSIDEIIENDYSFLATQFFDFVPTYISINKDEFVKKVEDDLETISELTSDNSKLYNELSEMLKGIKYE